jgi:hypothetical protein
MGCQRSEGAGEAGIAGAGADDQHRQWPKRDLGRYAVRVLAIDGYAVNDRLMCGTPLDDDYRWR